jgi:hypothetical protein
MAPEPHRGPEYQSEVALLTRGILLQSQGSEAERTQVGAQVRVQGQVRRRCRRPLAVFIWPLLASVFVDTLPAHFLVE